MWGIHSPKARLAMHLGTSGDTIKEDEGDSFSEEEQEPEEEDERGEEEEGLEVIDDYGSLIGSGNSKDVLTAAFAGAIGRSEPALGVVAGDGRQMLYRKMQVQNVDLHEMGDEEEEACLYISEALSLRQQYLFRQAALPEPDAVGSSPLKEALTEEVLFQWQPGAPVDGTSHTYQMVDGVMRVYDTALEDRKEVFVVPKTANDFFRDMHWILKVVNSGPCKTLCHHRLLLLEQKFNLHTMLNADREFLAQKSAPHRDFYNIRKVDTHVHHSACMNQKHLLRFIKSKLRKEPDEVVIFRDGKYLTLKEVFASLNLTGYDLNVDTMDMHADKNTFHRFDRFNLKYNPCGQSRLREIFIKQENLIQGRFLAELTKEVFSDLQNAKYQMTEYRISIYGRKKAEWDGLAGWVCNNRLFSENNVWLIQIPRLYTIYHKQGLMRNFQELLDNIFEPLFEVTTNPSSHPQLHLFLKQVVGFDMVDDESKCVPGNHPCIPPRNNNCPISCCDEVFLEPLVEEYSIAAQVWKLTSCDLCEIARNSVMQSGFPHKVKQHWVSDTYWKRGPEGNDIHRTNVPNIRLQFRKDVLEAEHELIQYGVSRKVNRVTSAA
eukprot:gene581-982_t